MESYSIIFCLTSLSISMWFSSICSAKLPFFHLFVAYYSIVYIYQYLFIHYIDIWLFFIWETEQKLWHHILILISWYLSPRYKQVIYLKKNFCITECRYFQIYHIMPNIFLIFIFPVKVYEITHDNKFWCYSTF